MKKKYQSAVKTQREKASSLQAPQLERRKQEMTRPRPYHRRARRGQ